jgi:hypothetical protein
MNLAWKMVDRYRKCYFWSADIVYSSAPVSDKIIEILHATNNNPVALEVEK